jgi:hypothetical protein
MPKEEKEKRKIDPKDSGHWVLEEGVEVFGDENKDIFGFVYKIELPNGFWYLGAKQVQFKKKLKALRGRVRARRTLVESDWREYTSSSNIINDYISKNGKEGIKFTILTIVKGGKFELKYCEMKHQVLSNCLFEEKSLNGIINARLNKRKNHIF